MLDTRIKVITLINDFLPAGAQQMVLNLARAIDKEQFDFIVCGIKEFGNPSKARATLLEEFQSSGIEAVNLKGAPTFSIREAFRDLRRVWTFLRRRRPHILHSHLLYANIIGVVAGRLAKVRRSVATEHGIPVEHLTRLRMLERLTLPLADVITCVSPRTEQQYAPDTQEFSPELLRQGRRVFTIYNGIDVPAIDKIGANLDIKAKRASLGLEEGIPTLGIVARLIPWKGHSFLLDVLSRVVRTESRLKLLVVGWGSEEKNLQIQTKQLGIEDKVIFLGMRKDVSEILPLIDIFVAPFVHVGVRVEGEPNLAMLEAMAAQKPVITTNVPGMDRTIHNGENGIIVPVGDGSALAQAILDLLRDPQKATRIGDEGRKLVEERFSLERSVKQYETLYKSILEI